jgi:hypothetical protein
MRKACGLNCGIKLIVENQALDEILSAFPHLQKKYTQTRPQPPLGTLFAYKV